MPYRALWLPILFVLTAPGAAQQPGEAVRLRPSRERVLSNPPSVPAAQAAFLKDGDMVIGVAQGGAAKAYWLPLVIWTHFIQDRLGDWPILVSW